MYYQYDTPKMVYRSTKVESINTLLENTISEMPKTSVSAGLAFSDNGLTKELFKNADAALYHTKSTTRRNCTIYRAELEGNKPADWETDKKSGVDEEKS